MKKICVVTLAAVALAAAACYRDEVAELNAQAEKEYLQPIRPSSEGRNPGWNGFSNKFIYAALVDDTCGKTLAASSSAKLGLENPSNCEAASKVGADLAEKAKKLGVETVVFDRSGYLYHGQVQALAEACRKAGLVF